MRSVFSRLAFSCFCFASACGGGANNSSLDGGMLVADMAESPVTCEPRAITALSGPSFTDISDASGIRVGNFVANPAMPIPINDHSRLGFADLNGDGLDDIVMHSLFPNPKAGIPFEHLVFMNNGDGTFTDASTASGLRDVQAGFLVFGDVDNDGDADCFAGLDIAIDGLSNAIYLNDGKGVFTQKANAGFDGDLGDTTTANAVFADFNNDAKLDLFLGNGGTVVGARDQIFIGNGDGTFSDATASRLLGTNPARPSNGVVTCDYDSDGDLDIFVATYGVSIQLGHNILWENDGSGKFTNVAIERGFAALAGGNPWLGLVADSEPGKDATSFVGSNAFGIDCQDINGDGYADIYLATISHPVDSDNSRKWSDSSQILINQGPQGGFSFVNRATELGLPFNEGDIDAATLDFDNDGRIDLSVTRERKYEGGYPEENLDQKAWFGLMHQLPTGQFESIGYASGINGMDVLGSAQTMKSGQNHAWSDIDGDGDLDLLVGGRDQGGGRPNFLFRNDVGSKNGWLALRLRGDGVHINRDALGTRVTIEGGGKKLTRELKSSRGTYDSTDTRTLYFGVGDLGCDYTLTVNWPDGTTTTRTAADVGLNRIATITY